MSVEILRHFRASAQIRARSTIRRWFLDAPRSTMADTARTPTPRRSPFAGLLDELVWEILLRLPPKTILRCRAVCRAWLRTTSDRAFLLAHHRRQPPQRLISFVRDVGADPDMSVVDYCLEGLDLRTHQLSSVVRFIADDRGAFIDSWFVVRAACDGLLLISLGPRLFLCNPATRQWTSVTPTSVKHDTIMGLYAHGPSGEYRVLYYRRIRGTPMFFINTVGSGSERRIWPDESSEVSVRNWLWRGSTVTNLNKPFLFRGNLHWLPVLAEQSNIMVFDTVAEVFRWFRTPVNMHWRVSLLEMEGTLALSDSYLGDSKVDLWLLQDYKSEVWVHKYRIELPVVEIQRFDEDPMEEDGEWCKDWSSQVVSQEGDVLVDVINWLLHYDNKGNMLQKFRCDGRLVNFTAHILKESLIPHAFFGKHQQDARAFAPPFFQWL